MEITRFDDCRVVSPTGGTLTAAQAAELGLIVQEDVVYCRRPGQTLHMDILRPALPEPDRLSPAVLYIHGGAWRHGTYKNGGGSSFAANGFVAFSMQYRFSQTAPHPAQTEDCLTALRWIQAHAAEYGVDPARIGVQGGSSGGHLALMTALLSEPGEIAAAIACCPPADLPGLYQAVLASNRYFADKCAKLIAEDPAGFGGLLGAALPEELSADSLTEFFCAPGFASAFDQLAGRELGDDPSPLEAASPLHLIKGCQKRLPPILLQHGLADPLVPAAQSLLMRDAILARGGEVELNLIPGALHRYEYDGDAFRPERIAAMVRFFQTHL